MSALNFIRLFLGPLCLPGYRQDFRGTVFGFAMRLRARVALRP